jgi:hypothetical protein
LAENIDCPEVETKEIPWLENSENIDCHEVATKEIPRLKNYTEEMMDVVVAAAIKGAKVCTNYMHIHSCVSLTCNNKIPFCAP